MPRVQCAKCGEEGSHPTWSCPHKPERAAKMLAMKSANAEPAPKRRPGRPAKMLAEIGHCEFCDRRRAYDKARK